LEQLSSPSPLHDLHLEHKNGESILLLYPLEMREFFQEENPGEISKGKIPGKNPGEKSRGKI
jgi:hypothetical protein